MHMMEFRKMMAKHAVAVAAAAAAHAASADDGG